MPHASPAPSDDTLLAYEILPPDGMTLAPASGDRLWMDQSRDRFAYRCLPLVIANQAGWTIACPRSFTARWSGGPQTKDVRLYFGSGQRDTRIMSHFGEGVITFWLPYLFRTPPGINLWIKGASNFVKDGAQPLEAIVEADWSVSTFTMNWKITRPRHPVRFEVGEPICMIVPAPRALAERLNPVLRPIERDAEIEQPFRAWSARRAEFLQALENRDPGATKRGWEKEYMQGRTPSGETFDDHQTRLHIRAFTRD